MPVKPFKAKNAKKRKAVVTKIFLKQYDAMMRCYMKEQGPRKCLSMGVALVGTEAIL